MAALRVEVVYALPRKALAVTLRLPAGSTVRDALVAARLPGVDLQRHSFGIFGERVRIGELLADGDRVEVYRPLELDPREARRQRARRRRQGKV